MENRDKFWEDSELIPSKNTESCKFGSIQATECLTGKAKLFLDLLPKNDVGKR